MGAWDVDIFSDDITADIKAEFDLAIEEGMNVKKATKFILKTFEDSLEDEDEAPLVILALAKLQLEKGKVEKHIKKKALHIIENGDGLERWEEAGEDILKMREKALQELKSELIK